MKNLQPVDGPVVTTDGEWSTVQVPGGQLGEAAGLLLDVVGVGQLKTVTHLPPGLAFKVPSVHAGAVHQALFGDGEGQGEDDPQPGEDDDPQEAPEPEEEPQEEEDPQGEGNTQPPAGNASKATWAAFLSDQGLAHPEDATRDDMVAIWEEAQEG